MCADLSKNGTLWFDELSMPEAEKAARDGKVVIIPCGSIEEHGTHLPLVQTVFKPSMWLWESPEKLVA